MKTPSKHTERVTIVSTYVIRGLDSCLMLRDTNGKEWKIHGCCDSSGNPFYASGRQVDIEIGFDGVPNGLSPVF